MSTSENLRKAAEIAKRLKHIKGQPFQPANRRTLDEITGCCIRGAIALGSGEEYGINVRDEINEVRVVVGECFIASDFNDLPTTTKDDVVQALDAAYILALQEEGVEPEDVL